MAQAANKTCEICMRAPGLHYCTQCDQVFCDDCKMSHLRSKISRSHNVLSGTDINTEKNVGCTDHDEDFIYLCGDCDQLICKLCVIKAHIKHALVDIKDSNKKVQTEISTYLDSKVKNARSGAQLIDGRTKTYETEVEAIAKVIMEEGNAIKEFVDKKVDALIKALRKTESFELQYLSKANKDFKDLLGEATRQQQIYQDVIKQCDEVAIFQKMEKIKSDIDNLKTAVDVTRLPSATYNRKSVNFSDVEKLFGNLTFQTQATPIRVALIGKTGAGKSALGNILLGEEKFKLRISSESATTKCEVMTGMLPCGRQITVVDTPGIMDTEGRDVRYEVTKAIAALSPGPHAILMVLQPGKPTEEEKRVIKQLKGLFGDETFLEHTIIVMTRKADITDENEDQIDIHSFINKMAAPSVKQLYEECGRRIVAVENKYSSQDDKHRYAKEVTDEVLKKGGYYSHCYFKLLMAKKIQAEETSKLGREIERVVNEQKRDNCSIQ